MNWLSDYLAMTPPGRKRRLTRAAGIASAVLVCHPETWEAVQELAGDLHPARKISGDVRSGSRDDGLVEVPLSGVGLATLMQAMHEAMTVYSDATRHRFPPHTRAVARRVYLAVARTAQQAAPGRAGAMPPILIDDRAPGITKEASR